MSDSLRDKALRQPFRFGLMLGALALPTGWTASQDALRALEKSRLLSVDEVTLLFAWGCVPGMILGAGAVRAWAAWLNRDDGEARWALLGHGAFVAVPCSLIFLSVLWSSYQDLSTLGWASVLKRNALAFYSNFPLQCALAMLLLGVFLRSRRA